MPLRLKLIRNEGEIRRFSLSDERMRSFSFQSLHDAVQSTFPSLTQYNLYYFENGLFMEIATANDWERALRYAHVLGSHPLSIHVTTDIEQVRMSMFAPAGRAGASMPSISAASLPVLGESSAPANQQQEDGLEQRFFKFIETIPVVLQDGVKEVQRMVETVSQSAEEVIAEKKIAESLNSEAEEIKAHVNTFVEQVKTSVDQVKEQMEQLLAKEEPRAPAGDAEVWEELPAGHSSEVQASEEPSAGSGAGVSPVTEQLAPVSELDSKFIRDFTYPDGSVVDAGQNFDKTWVIKNNSDKPWAAGTYLQQVGGKAFPIAFGSSVPAAQPGEEVNVSITLQAPQQEGKASAYFRLYHPIGQVGFGDRLWVDVKVERPFAYNEALSQLLAMGFPEVPCRILLEESEGDIIKVIDQF